MWPETELPHMMSECVPIAFTAALPTFSEFKHSLSTESIFKNKKANPFPPNVQTNSQIFTEWKTCCRPWQHRNSRSRVARMFCGFMLTKFFVLVLPAECNTSDNITENACFESWLLCKSSLLSRRASSQLKLAKSWKRFFFFE